MQTVHCCHNLTIRVRFSLDTMKCRFKTFEIDTQKKVIRANGREVALAPKAFNVLAYLIENHDRMVSKRELLDAFWPSNVSDAVLFKSVSQIRRALCKDSTEKFVKTHHGLGYRFQAQIEEVATKDVLVETAKVDQPMNVDLTKQRLISVVSVRFNDDAHAGLRQDQTFDLKSYLEQAEALVEEHQGHLLHMMIDGFTAVFGLHAISEDSARRALRCAQSLLASSDAQVLESLHLRIGIDMGFVDWSDIESQKWKPYGSLERHTLSLSQQAHSGAIFLSKSTVDQLLDDVESVPVTGEF